MNTLNENGKRTHSPGLEDNYADECLSKLNALKIERQELERIHKTELPKANGGADVQDTDILLLSVNGTPLTVERSILTCVKGSVLEILFSGRWENRLRLDENGGVFIHGDFATFNKVVDYLCRRSRRSGEEAPLDDPGRSSEASLLGYYILLGYYVLNRPSKAKEEFVAKSEYIYDILLEKAQARNDKLKRENDAEKTLVRIFTTSDSRDRNEDDKDDISPMQNGIVSLCLRNGEVLKVAQDTLCLFPKSRLAKMYSNETWLKENSWSIFISHPWVAFKALIIRLQEMFLLDEETMEVRKFEVSNEEERKDFDYLVDHYLYETVTHEEIATVAGFVAPSQNNGDLNGETENADADDVLVQPDAEIGTGFVALGKDDGDINGGTKYAEANDALIQPATETATATGVFSSGKSDVDLECSENESTNSSPVKL